MFRSVTLTILLGCFVVLISRHVVSGWFFGGGSSKTDEEKTETAPVPRGKVPFELQTSDDKFLLQAQGHKELSELDVCHHTVSMSWNR